MEQWSALAVAKARPAWINLFGVPLNHWNSELFFHMGSAIGETLLIDDETLFKNSLHMGRMLELINHETSCPKQIKVADIREVF
ncbi:hypothetical protein LWI28_022641 [Acer negundo]|uniref:DUF4283 domain-containing protein n=1 Tax=Acer negundo TaxID=4023 RepID=A0AAD5P2X3_ACENE|nr:hypothetical protein LWI28_022641 [Acer negundo]